MDTLHETAVTSELAAEVIITDDLPGKGTIDLAYEIASISQGRYRGTRITAASALTFHIVDADAPTAHPIRVRFAMSDLFATALVARDKITADDGIPIEVAADDDDAKLRAAGVEL